MAITSTYPIITPKLGDLIVGTQTYTAADPVLDNPTRNFTVQSIADVVQNNGGTTNVIPAFSATGLVDSLISQDNSIVYIGTQASGTRFTNTSVSAPFLLGTDLYAANIYGQNGGLLNIKGNSTIGNELSDTLDINATIQDGFHMKSADGSVFKITVSNAGALVVTAV
tara:strand:+ start:208 stop:711 length:504 start_codon:yes stop_codon:yes gene_type:complete